MAIEVGVPWELDPIVLKALSKMPGDGYEPAATMAAGLRSVAAVVDVRSGDRAPPAYAPMHVRRASSSR